jgi:uncharacterized membrane protein HdeD (DUF308 family)
LKTGLLPGINHLMVILAVTLSFFPLILYWRKRLAADKSYMIITIFWTVNGILYIPEIFHWEWYNSTTDLITLYYNLVDGPLIFLFFYYAFKKKVFLYLIGAFVIFEAIMIAWMGFNFDSDTIIIGIGSLVCLILNIWGISNYFMKVEHTKTENVLVYVFAGFIFYYGLFAVVWRYNYLRPSGQEKPYVLLINWSSICLATALISYGLWKYAETQYREERY